MIESKLIQVCLGDEEGYPPNFLFMGFTDGTFGLKWPFYLYKQEYMKRYFSGNKGDIKIEDNRENEEQSVIYMHLVNDSQVVVPINYADMDSLISWYKS